MRHYYVRLMLTTALLLKFNVNTCKTCSMPKVLKPHVETGWCLYLFASSQSRRKSMIRHVQARCNLSFKSKLFGSPFQLQSKICSSIFSSMKYKFLLPFTWTWLVLVYWRKFCAMTEPKWCRFGPNIDQMQSSQPYSWYEILIQWKFDIIIYDNIEHEK